MKLLKVLLLAFLLGLAFAFLLDTFAQSLSAPRGYVNDYANIFTESQKSALESSISEYEKQTSIEISVVTVDDIQNTVIEDYANKLFNTWGIGKKQSDAGLLIFLSLDTFDRGLRIEVGYGLEEFMTDYQASQIIDDVMPLLKDGDYATALQNSVSLSMNIIGTRSAESRQLYLDGLAKDKAKRNELIVKIIILIAGAFIIFLVIFFVYRLFKARKERIAKEANYKRITKSNLDALQSVYDETLQAIEHLNTQKFYGADEVLSRLKRQERAIKTELPDRLAKSKKHEDVIKIADDVDRIGDKLKDLATEIFENHNIESAIRGKLETQVENIKRKVQNALPQARQAIEMVNKDNPESIWRNFDYKNLDRNVEASFDKSDQAIKLAIKQLDGHSYKEAKSTANLAVIHMENAYKYVQSIFDVNQQIRNGKEVYNQQISRLPELIKTTNGALQRNNVDSSTRNKISDIQGRYGELQEEIKKGKLLDWILIGALITKILADCNDAVRQSSRDISNYEEEEERKRRRKREEDSRRSSYSSYGGGGGGGSSFGGFGGGRSGGGGSTGRF